MNAITDLEGRTYLLSGYKQAKRTRRVNGEKELSFTLYRTPQNSKYFDSFAYLWDVHFQEDDYKALLFTDATKGNGYTREVACINTFYDDLRCSYQPERQTKTFSLDEALAFALQNADYSFNIIDTVNETYEIENFGQADSLSMLLKVLKRWGAEFYVSGNSINIVAKRGRTTDFQYRHKVNLESMERETDAMDFVTVVHAIGKRDEDTDEPLVEAIYENTAMIEKYGRRTKVISDERFTKGKEKLREKAKQEQEDSIKASYKFKFFDMRNQGYPRAQPQEGDTVLLYDERMDIALDARIVEIEEIFDEKDNLLDCTVTISNFDNVETQRRQDREAINNVQRILEGNAVVPFEALTSAVKQATQEIQSLQTQLTIESDGSLVAIDKDDPNNRVRLSAGGIGVTDDAGSSYKTAMTGSGIVADVITSGTIRTNNVRIEGASGNMYMDGDQFVAKDADDPDKYVRIIPGHAYFTKGGVSFERPDGYVVFENGVATANYEVQNQLSPPIDPSVANDTITRGPRSWIVQTTSKQQIAYIGFKHTSRYLNVQASQISEFSETENVITVESVSGGEGVLAENRSTNVSEDADKAQVIITVDLGTPDGGQRNVHIYTWGSSENTVYTSIMRAWMSG